MFNTAAARRAKLSPILYRSPLASFGAERPLGVLMQLKSLNSDILGATPVSSPEPQRACDWARVPLTVALIGGIFAADTFTELRSAVATLYVLPLMILAARERRAPCLKVFAGLCLGLTLLSFLLVHGRPAELGALLRMGTSLAAIVVATLLILRVQRAFARLESGERRHRTTLDTTPTAICEYDFSPIRQTIDHLRQSGVVDLAGYLASHPDLVARIEASARLMSWNSAARSLFNLHLAAPILGQAGFLPHLGAQFAKVILAIDDHAERVEIETEFTCLDGARREVIVVLSCNPQVAISRVPCAIIDMTDRNRLSREVACTRAELERSQRAVILGQMSATIAHEINQPMAAIRNFSSAARRWMEADPPDLLNARAAAKDIEAGVDRVEAVIDRMRSVTGAREIAMEAIDVDDLVRETAGLMRDGIDRSGTWAKLRLRAPGARVTGDRILLQQALLNLIQNAAQAMEEAGVASPVELDTRIDGDRIVIGVSDRGPGLPAGFETWGFEPFQTTKARGMGVGLAICQTILTTHAGGLHLTDRVSDQVLGQISGGVRAELWLPLERVAAVAAR